MILQYPNRILRQVCTELPVGSPRARETGMALLAAMAECSRPCLGLSANQVGSTDRIFVLDVKRLRLKTKSIFVNPEITWKSEETLVAGEGCMSFRPGMLVPIERAVGITLAAYTPGWKRIEVTLKGLAARCVQQEMDHLDGVLIIDHEMNRREAAVPVATGGER